jgi:hypothetical protein
MRTWAPLFVLHAAFFRGKLQRPDRQPEESTVPVIVLVRNTVPSHDHIIDDVGRMKDVMHRPLAIPMRVDMLYYHYILFFIRVPSP